MKSLNDRKTIGTAAMVMGLVLAFSAQAEEARDQRMVVAGLEITLPGTWKKMERKPGKPGIIGTRQEKKGDAQATIGDVMVAELAGSVAKESAEMEEMAKRKPQLAKLADAGEFATAGGLKGRKVILLVSAKTEDYEAPLAFYSIYLPRPDGSCVTFKLRCGANRLDDLKKEFEDMVAKAVEPNLVEKKREN